MSINDCGCDPSYKAGAMAGGRRKWSRTMLQDDMRYFQRRAREERERAEAAADPCARQAHRRIAAEYERLVGRMETNQPRMMAE